MMHKLLLTLLIVVGLVVLPFFIYLCYESYQQGLSADKIPDVIAIYDEIRQVPGSQPKEEMSVSAHEFAATVLWQSYTANISCEELRGHFDAEVARRGFQLSREYRSVGSPEVHYRKGEYEIRVLCNEDGYAFSINWNGGRS